jgi:pre-rRNA-processing protein TSR1
MLVEDIRHGGSDSDLTVLTGVVRGRGLKADRLVQIGDWGTFQIHKVTAAPLRPMVVEDTSNNEVVLDIPSTDRDDLADLAPDDVLMMDDDQGEGNEAASSKKGVLLDDYRYFSDEDAPEESHRKRVPKGTSGYQSAWYLDDDASEDGSDYEDLDMADVQETPAEAEEGDGGDTPHEQTEAAPSEYQQSEMVIEPDENEDARQLEAYRAGKKNDEVEDDKEFPDEIELQPNVLARERLARYRGLRSLRDSVWQHSEDRAHEPADWRRLLQIPDYKASWARSTREALVGGVAPGTRVNIYVAGVPRDRIREYPTEGPITLFSLLRHEHKKTVVNYLINLSSDYPKSIKSKEELIVQCGSRRFVINPLISQPGITPNDVHKYCRWLHPGQSAVATFTGPVTWGSVPVLFFKRSSGLEEQAESSEGSNIGLTLVGTGTSLPPSTSRVIAKRVVLTGHPYHIHKKVVTIRYMFFNKEDVDWFKALPFWTKRGRRGEIKESLGTHGYFKAYFDGRINPQDSVAVSLYKRVWPRNAIVLSRPLVEGSPEHQDDNGGDMNME